MGTSEEDCIPCTSPMWRVAEAVGGDGSCECDARGLNEGSVVLQPFYCRQDHAGPVRSAGGSPWAIVLAGGEGGPATVARPEVLFEDVIAQVTALAVLLPVVAGESGNAGAPALAVTMRGLVLREISLRHWPHMVWKEASVELINGVAVALTTALAVRVWSRSAGLVVVIVSAMVISMVMAGITGALVPIGLRRFGQDPAQSSSIVLTTVTDVTGLFSFLGIATVLAAHLR